MWVCEFLIARTVGQRPSQFLYLTGMSLGSNSLDVVVHLEPKLVKLKLWRSSLIVFIYVVRVLLSGASKTGNPLTV